MAFVNGLLIGGVVAAGIAAVVFFGIILRNLRPLGWLILIAVAGFLLSRL